MFILPLPSPTSSKCLSEGHPAGHLPVSCSPRCAREVGDACRVDLSESSRGAEPEGCKRWEKQSCLVLSGCPHTQGHRRTYSSNKCSAGLRTLFQDALAGPPWIFIWQCFLSLSGATPPRSRCSRAGAVISTAGAGERGQVVEGDVGKTQEQNPLASRDR